VKHVHDNSRLNLDDLVRRSKEGTVTSKEIDRVVKILSADEGGDGTYRLLYVIGRSVALSHEKLVASFLEYRKEPFVARLALQILCSFWDLTDRYVDQVERFLKGVEWDDEGDVRQIAITSAGEFLRDRRHCELLKTLLVLGSPENENALERRIAVEAIARALGEPLGETINADKGDIPWETWAQSITARGAARLAKGCA
jgi:hypothetical protein